MITPPPSLPSLLAFGAHPDDIEFGCGGVIARESRAGRPIHFAVASRGEAATHGTPAERAKEAENAARILGASVEFLEMGGDAHIQENPAHAIQLAAVIRRTKPSIVLAPSPVDNQHPDHPKIGRMARDAARLARYGGVSELALREPHAIASLWFYAVTPEAEPRDISPVFFDVSDPEIIAQWTAAMEAHGSQVRARNYVELQLTRARLNGLRAGIGHAIALFPNDPPVLDSFGALARTARRF